MRKTPTPKQADRLRVLGSFAVAIAPSRGDWNSLLRRGWVETIGEDDHDKGFLPPVRITPAGLRALADALERDGHVELSDVPRQASESPVAVAHREALEKLRRDRDEAQREATRLRSRLRSAKRALDGEF